MAGRLLTAAAALLFVLLIGQGSAWATCPVPNTFVNNQVADADQVNANFTALVTCFLSNFVTGPLSSSVGNVACWNSTSGAVLKECATGTWTAYTPVITCQTGGPALGAVAATGEYLRLGRFIAFTNNIVVGTNGTCGGAWTVTIPVASSAFAFAVNGRSTTKGTLSCGIAANVNFCQAYDLSYFAVDGTVVAISGLYEANTN